MYSIELSELRTVYGEYPALTQTSALQRSARPWLRGREHILLLSFHDKCFLCSFVQKRSGVLHDGKIIDIPMPNNIYFTLKKYYLWRRQASNLQLILDGAGKEPLLIISWASEIPGVLIITLYFPILTVTEIHWNMLFSRERFFRGCILPKINASIIFQRRLDLPRQISGSAFLISDGGFHFPDRLIFLISSVPCCGRQI